MYAVKPLWAYRKDDTLPPPDPKSDAAIDERLNQYYAEIQLKKIKPYHEESVIGKTELAFHKRMKG